MHRYYITYIYKSKTQINFGEMTITNKNKLKMNTIEDIKNTKSFILENIKKEDSKIEGIMIMDFRELEE